MVPPQLPSIYPAGLFAVGGAFTVEEFNQADISGSNHPITVHVIGAQVVWFGVTIPELN